MLVSKLLNCADGRRIVTHESKVMSFDLTRPTMTALSLSITNVLTNHARVTDKFCPTSSGEDDNPSAFVESSRRRLLAFCYGSTAPICSSQYVAGAVIEMPAAVLCRIAVPTPSHGRTSKKRACAAAVSDSFMIAVTVVPSNYSCFPSP